MSQRIVLFVTDLRQRYIGEFLRGKVSSLYWSDEKEEADCLEKINKADIIVLPTPASKVLELKDMGELLKENMKNTKLLFGGKIGREWESIFHKRGVKVVDFMAEESVAYANAKITAEATVAEILKYSCYSIEGQKIVITGYGKCAEALAHLLKKMGAKVTVLARSSRARKKAKAAGVNAVDFCYGPEEMYGTGTLVNTVPAMVVGANMISEMHKDTVIIDIASKPGGTDLKAAERYNIPVIPALGLPGIYSTKSSAQVMVKAIEEAKKAFLDQEEHKEKGKAFLEQGEHSEITQIIL